MLEYCDRAEIADETISTAVDLDDQCYRALSAITRGEPLEAVLAHITDDHSAAPGARAILSDLHMQWHVPATAEGTCSEITQPALQKLVVSNQKVFEVLQEAYKFPDGQLYEVASLYAQDLHKELAEDKSLSSRQRSQDFYHGFLRGVLEAEMVLYEDVLGLSETEVFEFAQLYVNQVWDVRSKFVREFFNRSIERAEKFDKDPEWRKEQMQLLLYKLSELKAPKA